MGRKVIQRKLIPLTELASEFRGFRGDTNKTSALEEWLRKIISQCRMPGATPFFARREVASFFGVNQSTVSVVYKRLEKEGLLLCRRSSGTELTASRNPKRVIHRGIVAIPIWLPGFLTFEHWRVFFIELEERLRHYDFIANLIFYRYEEEMRPDFAHRVLLHNPEYLIWLMPLLNARPTIEMLADKGVRPIILSKADDPKFRGQRYILRNDKGFRRCLEAWRKRGIKSVLFLHDNDSLFDTVPKHADDWMRQTGLECRFTSPGNNDWNDYLAGLARHEKAGVVFEGDILFHLLCTHHPQAMDALFRRVPVLVQYPVNLPPEYGRNSYVDWLGYDWKAFARRVALDLDTGRIVSAAPPTVFEAEWKPHVPVADVMTVR